MATNTLFFKRILSKIRYIHRDNLPVKFVARSDDILNYALKKFSPYRKTFKPAVGLRPAGLPFRSVTLQFVLDQWVLGLPSSYAFLSLRFLHFPTRDLLIVNRDEQEIVL